MISGLPASCIFYGRALVRRVLPAVLLPLLLQGCFSEIESTPKISYKEVRRENAGPTEEQKFAAGFCGDPASQWVPGKRFLVADSRAYLTYVAPAGKSTEVAAGDTIVYRGVREVPAITGGVAREMIFTRGNAPLDSLLYRPGRSASGGDSTEVRLPFLVDLSLVGKVGDQLVGKEFYTRTDRWLAPAGGTERRGRKFVKVRVTRVDAFNEDYPFMVSFRSLERDGEEGAMAMSVSVSGEAPALRDFASLFLLKNPRDNYPQITDSRWELIRRGEVEAGMTTVEASLSLGYPREIDRRHDQSLMYERWSYPGGRYLVFEDGLLVRFNR